LDVLPLFGDRKPIAMLTSPFIEDMGQISSNGKWLADRSNESGTSEIYVLAFAPNDAAARRKWRVSTDGGMKPQWRADRKELFYLNGSTLMSAEVKAKAVSSRRVCPKSSSISGHAVFLKPRDRRFSAKSAVTVPGCENISILERDVWTAHSRSDSPSA
jgi:hypothetical protein